MQELISKTARWHHNRNLIEGSTNLDQQLKLIQEVGELSDSICKGLDPKDDIGDILVVLINIMERNKIALQSIIDYHYRNNYLETTLKELVVLLTEAIVRYKKQEDLCFWYGWAIIDLLREIANRSNLTLEECLAHAYDEIKDRRGRMVDGIFIKEE